MIADIHKPDISTLVTTGHFYFGWTSKKQAVDEFFTAVVAWVPHSLPQSPQQDKL
jgi:hypothetical protein